MKHKKITNMTKAGRSGKYFLIFIIMGMLSGLFGCGKSEEYISSEMVLDQEEETQVPPEEENITTTEVELEPVMEAQPEKEVKELQNESVYIHVCGAVRSPGVYEFSPGVRVYQAIERAGGTQDKACGEALNQALELTDGAKIYVPTLYEWTESGESLNCISYGQDSENGSARGQSADVMESDTIASDGKVNINTADVSKLTTLSGIGETRAKAIIEYREAQGRFEDITQIQNVSGIGESTFQKLKDNITVN